MKTELPVMLISWPGHPFSELEALLDMLALEYTTEAEFTVQDEAAVLLPCPDQETYENICDELYEEMPGVRTMWLDNERGVWENLDGPVRVGILQSLANEPVQITKHHVTRKNSDGTVYHYYIRS